MRLQWHAMMQCNSMLTSSYHVCCVGANRKHSIAIKQQLEQAMLTVTGSLLMTHAWLQASAEVVQL
jgi:hypothetical protein